MVPVFCLCHNNLSTIQQHACRRYSSCENELDLITTINLIICSCVEEILFLNTTAYNNENIIQAPLNIRYGRTQILINAAVPDLFCATDQFNVRQ